MSLLEIDWDEERGCAIWDVEAGTFCHYFPGGYQEPLLPRCKDRDGWC
jgi:hypothetical protein